MRFGIMCTGTEFQRWQADAIRLLIRDGHLPALLIVDGRDTIRHHFLSRLVHKSRKTLLFSFLENRLFFPDARRRVSLETELSGVPVVTCKPSVKGFSENFSDVDIQTVRGFRLDFILRFGFNIIRGEILQVATHGIWSFHHDDEMKYRGGPAGFWEIFYGDPVSGAVLQRLTDRLDGGIVLRKGYLRTIGHSYKGNLEQLLTVSSEWPAWVAREINPGFHGLAGEAQSPSRTRATIYKIPGNVAMLRFLFQLFVNRLRFYWREFLLAEQWNCGIVAADPASVAFGKIPLNPQTVTWLPHPGSASYYADPAGFTLKDRWFIYMEQFSYRSMRGQISAIGIGKEGQKEPEDFHNQWDIKSVFNPFEGILADSHLSYPSVIRYRDDLYCIPETSATGKVIIYSIDPETARVGTGRVIIDGFAAVDPTLVFHEGGWYLFCTERRFSNSHLYIFRSDDLFGTYSPHPGNPVKIDIRSARPAGSFFLHEGALYRPAQDCSRTYGGSVVIHKVSTLSPDAYAEIPVSTLLPVAGSRYTRGIHTLSSAGDFTLIDGKYHRIIPSYFFRQIHRRIVRGKDRHD